MCSSSSIGGRGPGMASLASSLRDVSEVLRGEELDEEVG